MTADEQHRDAQAYLQRRVEQRLAELLGLVALADRQRGMSANSAAAWTLVSGAQRRAAGFAASYLHLLVTLREPHRLWLDHALIERDVPVCRSPVLRL